MRLNLTDFKFCSFETGFFFNFLQFWEKFRLSKARIKTRIKTKNLVRRITGGIKEIVNNSMPEYDKTQIIIEKNKMIVS